MKGLGGVERGPVQDTDWVDREAFPFTPRSFEVDGANMHYVDEGEGPSVLLVHGTTTWSFMYRDLIRTLSQRYRCIAPDHLGYGLSDKPEGVAYRPRDHARRLRAFIEHLELRDVALVVHDFGGPIGLAYALEEPQNVRALVLFNTWMWTLRREPMSHHYYAVYEREEQVRELSPRLAALERFHCALTPFWAQRLGTSRLRASQLSRRGGSLQCEDTGERILLSGQVAPTWRGSSPSEGPPVFGSRSFADHLVGATRFRSIRAR